MDESGTGNVDTLDTFMRKVCAVTCGPGLHNTRHDEAHAGESIQLLGQKRYG